MLFSGFGIGRCGIRPAADRQSEAPLHLALFVDVRGTPVGNVGVFRPGSNYNGATVYPVMDPATFLASVAFPYAHPQARPPQILERKPLPALVEELKVGAPESQFDSLAPIFAIIENSVKINPQWLAGGIQGQIHRGKKSLEI